MNASWTRGRGPRAALLLAALAVGTFAASPVLVPPVETRTTGPLLGYPGAGAAADAVATLDVVLDTSGRTHTTLTVRGLEPDRKYGAHVHTGGCDPLAPEAAGPHLQHVPNPEPEEQPLDPVYVNPGNEIWLDVTTDRTGAGTTTSTVEWQFSPHRVPASVIIHEHATWPHPRAGWAGAPLACLAVTL